LQYVTSHNVANECVLNCSVLAAIYSLKVKSLTINYCILVILYAHCSLTASIRHLLA